MVNIFRKNKEKIFKNFKILNYNNQILNLSFEGAEYKKDWFAIYRVDQIEWFKKKTNISFTLPLRNKPGNIPALLWLYCNNSQEKSEVYEKGNVKFNELSKHKKLDEYCQKNKITFFPLDDGIYKLYFFYNNSYKSYLDPITFEIKEKELINHSI